MKGLRETPLSGGQESPRLKHSWLQEKWKVWHEKQRVCLYSSGWVWPMEALETGGQQEREVRVYYFLLWQWLHPSRSSPFPVTPVLTELLCHHFLLLLSSPKGYKATLCCWFLGTPSPLVDSLISTHTSVNTFFIKRFSFEPAELNSLPAKIPTGTEKD